MAISTVSMTIFSLALVGVVGAVAVGSARHGRSGHIVALDTCAPTGLLSGSGDCRDSESTSGEDMPGAVTVLATKADRLTGLSTRAAKYETRLSRQPGTSVLSLVRFEPIN